MILRSEDSPEFFLKHYLWKNLVLFKNSSRYIFFKIRHQTIKYFKCVLTAFPIFFAIGCQAGFLHCNNLLFFQPKKIQYNSAKWQSWFLTKLCQNNRGEIVTSKCCMHKNASSSIVPCVSCWPQKNIKYSTRATVYVVNIWPPFLLVLLY